MKKKASFAERFKRLVGGLREAPPEDMIANEMAALAERRKEARREAGMSERPARPCDIEELDDPGRAGEDIRDRGIAFHRRAAVVDDEQNFGGFTFEVEDAFSIAGRGTVVTGVITEGMVRVGDKARLYHSDGKALPVTISGMEAFRKKKERAFAGEHVGILLRDLPQDQAARGDRLVGGEFDETGINQ